ncbi:hypothetical protein LLEC1_02988 [Akanthomyces lecanii]|uniref:GH18 domain-containing protein n=1 Tax=Cordyceps confragosa TaxID=2714763 RepID=A0A179I4N0_CORDF|nr:hypothetical protein LLEC1_02988 [Akanthomyces lecanii]
MSSNGGGVVEKNDLATYYSQSAAVDIVVLSFLHQYGNGNKNASGTIGQSCYTAPSDEWQNSDDLSKAIDTCKSNSVKVIVSLGGAAGLYSLSSQDEAEVIGQNLREAYGNLNRANGSVPRPFGKHFGNQFYPAMIAKLRGNFASDASNQHYITDAPQCPIPEPNMNEIITQPQFDYIWVQFYNSPSCAVDGTINFDDWKKSIANTPSSNAKIFIGVPALPLEATGTQSGARYYLEPAELASLVGEHKSDAAFGGVMMWAAAFSDANGNNGCTMRRRPSASSPLARIFKCLTYEYNNLPVISIANWLRVG